MEKRSLEQSVGALKSLGRDSRHILRKGVSVEVCEIYWRNVDSLV